MTEQFLTVTQEEADASCLRDVAAKQAMCPVQQNPIGFVVVFCVVLKLKDSYSFASLGSRLGDTTATPVGCQS